jgi:hypothetical protein
VTKKKELLTLTPGSVLHDQVLAESVLLLAQDPGRQGEHLEAHNHGHARYIHKFVFANFLA